MHLGLRHSTTGTQLPLKMQQDETVFRKRWFPVKRSKSRIVGKNSSLGYICGFDHCGKSALNQNLRESTLMEIIFSIKSAYIMAKCESKKLLPSPASRSSECVAL